MSQATTETGVRAPVQSLLAGRVGLALLVLLGILGVTLFVGVRYGLMLSIGLGFGVALEALRFGFAGPWRAMILRRDPAGLWAQLLAIGLVSVVALPLIAANPGEINPARAPIGFAMVLGAFVFGIAMQVVLGCGSGTLVNAGSGNPVSLLALPFFALGSFLGAYHLIWWTELGAWQAPNFTGWSGAAAVVGLLALTALVVGWFSERSLRRLPPRLIWAALALALLAVLNLVVSGQPWGVVYGLGLWVAKLFVGLGGDLTASAFWSAPSSVTRISDSVLTDYTSLSNMGILFGAFLVASWKQGGLSQALPSLPARAWVSTVVAGLLLGYASRLAFGCNVGAYFSGISTGSLHGWVWLVAAFAGSVVGVRLRPMLGFEGRT